MPRKRFYLAIVLICAVSVNSLNAQCDSIGWSNDPAVNLHVSIWGQESKACSDGQGGAFLSWNTNSFNTYQYVQYVDRCGIIRWEQPVAVHGEWNGTAFNSHITEDGVGGALIAYSDQLVEGNPPFENRARVNRIDTSGNLLWGEEGVLATLHDAYSIGIQVAPDLIGGAFVSVGVYDQVDFTIYLQRISASGERLWGEEGIFVADSSGAPLASRLVADGQGGVVFHWLAYDTGFKRYDAEGNLLWYLPGPDIGWYEFVKPTGDGAVVVGRTVQGGTKSIVVNKVTPEGEYVWGEEGITVEEELPPFSGAGDMILRTDSVLVVFWTLVHDVHSDYDIYTQMIRPDGTMVFPESIPISAVDGLKGGGRCILSDDDAIIYVWNDQRSGEDEFYAQKLDTVGVRLWGSSDIKITSQDHTFLAVISDQYDGIVAIWDDSPLNGVFAQQVSSDGILGEVADDIMAVEPTGIQPAGFILHPNYPNPFNSETTIKFELPKPTQLELSIYDISGRKARVLVSGSVPAGEHNVNWDGTDNEGRRLASGVYLVRLLSHHFSTTRKMLLIS